MAQPKTTPTAVRFRPEVDAGITAYVEKTGMSRNSAINDLVAQGLEADGSPPEKSKGAPAARAAVIAKGLPLIVAADLPGAPKTANQIADELNAERERVDRARAGWFAPKGRSK